MWMCFYHVHRVSTVLPCSQFFYVGQTEVWTLGWFALTFFRSQNTNIYEFSWYSLGLGILHRFLFCDYFRTGLHTRLEQEFIVRCRICIIFESWGSLSYWRNIKFANWKHITVGTSVFYKIINNFAFCLIQSALLADKHELRLRVLGIFKVTRLNFRHNLEQSNLVNTCPTELLAHLLLTDNVFILSGGGQGRLFEQSLVILEFNLGKA